MSEYTKNQLATLKENAEIFKSTGLKWISSVCNKEYNNISKQVSEGLIM